MVAAVSDNPLDNSLDNLIDNLSGNSMDNSLGNLPPSGEIQSAASDKISHSRVC